LAARDAPRDGFVTPQIFAIPQTLGGPRAAGTWMALQNMVGNFAGIVAPIVTGFVVVDWDHTAAQPSRRAVTRDVQRN
jgi:hypothetical protein